MNPYRGRRVLLGLADCVLILTKTVPGMKVVHIRPDWYGVGLSKTLTNAGNEVPVYDRERTICDIIRGKKDMEVQTFQTAMKEYMGGP